MDKASKKLKNYVLWLLVEARIFTPRINVKITTKRSDRWSLSRLAMRLVRRAQFYKRAALYVKALLRKRHIVKNMA